MTKYCENIIANNYPFCLFIARLLFDYVTSNWLITLSFRSLSILNSCIHSMIAESDVIGRFLQRTTSQWELTQIISLIPIRILRLSIDIDVQYQPHVIQESSLMMTPKQIGCRFTYQYNCHWEIEGNIDFIDYGWFADQSMLVACVCVCSFEDIYIFAFDISMAVRLGIEQQKETKIEWVVSGSLWGGHDWDRW